MPVLCVDQMFLKCYPGYLNGGIPHLFRPCYLIRYPHYFGGRVGMIKSGPQYKLPTILVQLNDLDLHV